MEPITLALLAGGSALAGGGISAIGNASQRRAQEKENRPFRQFQERKNNLIDQLLASLEGNGKYSDLFKTDEAAFQRSFVDPAKSMFNNQIAPQIQQQSIANGMQRSSSLDDQLLRAGVDLDQMLNQHYMQFQNQGKDRISNALSGILGGQAANPLQQGPTTGNSISGAASGALSGFSNTLAMQSMIQTMFPQQAAATTTVTPNSPTTPVVPQPASSAPRAGFYGATYNERQ